MQTISFLTDFFLKKDMFCVNIVCSFLEFLDVFPKLSREHQVPPSDYNSLSRFTTF